MSYARRIAIFCFSLLLLSCATSPQESTGEPVPLSSIVDYESAQRALIIAQDVRISSVRVIKEAVKTGVRPSSDIEKVRPYDEKFREYWDKSNSALKTFKVIGDVSWEDFKSNYELLLIQLLELQREASNG